MELYSKEELLKELKKEYSCGGECDHCPEVLDAGSCSVLRCIRRIIDNNQPVEYPFYQEAYQTGYEEGKNERPQGELKEYKPLEPDYNVQCAVENLRSAYWSNEPEKVAKNFTEAEDIIISAICHHGYAVCKQPQGELANEVWKLYEKHHSHLATHVIEFGDELKELLGKYQKGGAEND